MKRVVLDTNIYGRLKFMDILIFACALENKPTKFVTLDSDFLESRSLKEKFKEVKIDDKV